VTLNYEAFFLNHHIDTYSFSDSDSERHNAFCVWLTYVGSLGGNLNVVEECRLLGCYAAWLL
jgi:hypothetical protein